MSDYIPDGHYFPGHINADPQKGHGELDFEYRPALYEDQAKFADDTENKRNEQGVIVGVSDAVYAATELAFCAPRVRAWSLKDVNGNPVPCTPKEFKNIRPVLRKKICSIVLGYQLNDEKPQSESLLEQSEKNS